MMKSAVEGDTSTAAPLQAGTSAGFVLGLGTDGLSPPRKVTSRARNNTAPSRIPQRPTGGTGPSAVQASTGLMNSGPAPSGPVANTDGPNITPRDAQGPGGAPGAQQPAVPLPSFAVGAVDSQTAGTRTPRGPRMRASKFKTSAPSPLVMQAPAAAATRINTILPFSPIGLESLESMTPIDDNTYQKLASNAGQWGLHNIDSPMDITPQGSMTSAASNVFLFSPLINEPFEGQSACSGAGGDAAAGGAAMASSAPMPFSGFAAAAPSTAPAAAVGTGNSGSTATGGAASASSAQAPAPAPDVAPRPTSNSGTASNGSNMRFPIQIQIPGAREVQDMFTSAASASTTVAPGAAGPSSRGSAGPRAGASGTTGGPKPNGATVPNSSVAGATAPSRQQGPQSGRMAMAVAAAAAKKLPEADAPAPPSGPAASKSGLGGNGSGGASSNDCQPPKDNAAKATRISVDSGNAAAGCSKTAATTAAPFPATSAAGGKPSVAAAPPQTAPSTSSVATAAAAVGFSAACAVTVASAPSDATSSLQDILMAAAEQLEHMARRTREAAAAATVARAVSGGSNATAAVEAVIATLADESNPAIRSVLEIMLRPGAVDAKVAAAAAAARVSVAETAPGLAAAVACMLGALKLDELRPGEPHAIAGGGSRGSSAGGISSVPFVFGSAGRGGSAGSSQGGGSAAPAPAAPTSTMPPPLGSVVAPTASAIPPMGPSAVPATQVPQQQQAGASFLFGVAGVSYQSGGQPSATGVTSAPAVPSVTSNFGSSTASAFGSVAGVAAATTAFGAVPGAAMHQAPSHQQPAVPFVFGGPGLCSRSSTQPAPQEAASGSMRSGQSSEQSATMESGQSSASLMSAVTSPMSTTPAAASQSTTSTSSGWAGVPPTTAITTSPGGGGTFTFTVGDAGGPAANNGVTPGRIGGRARAKITPRKARTAMPMDCGMASQPKGGCLGSAADPSSATCNGTTAAPLPPPPNAATGTGPSEKPAGAAAASAGQLPSRPQASSGGVSSVLDAAAAEATRLKRDADEKKQYGNQKYEMGDFRLAERWYSEAIDVIENKLPQLGLSREKLQQLFSNLKTEAAVLYSNRSGARLMTAKPNSALADALRAMELDPRFMRAASRAATCHCRLGDFAAAHRIIDVAMDRCSAASSNYQDLLKKLNEVVDLGSRARAATAAAVSAVSNGSREKLQEAADQLATIRDQVGYCEVVAAARAVLALRLGFAREVLTLVAPHPEVPLQQRAAPWRMWLILQAHYFKADLQEALTVCRELQLSLEAAGPVAGGDDAGSAAPAGQEQDASAGGAAAAAAYTTSAHVTVPPPAFLGELAESLQHMLKLKEDGNNAIKQNRHTEAAELYTKALGLGCSPAYAAVLHANRAAAHAAQGAVVDAVADCGRARALDPTYYKATWRLASYMVELRRPDDAQGLLEPLTKLGSQSNGSGPRPDELAMFKERLSEARSASAWQKTPQHYKLLGLSNNCSEEDIRKAYRRLALKHHPDKALSAVKVSMVLPGRAGGAPYSRPVVGINELETRVREEAAWLFNFINQAHEELSDRSRRRKIDQLLDVEQPPQAGRYGSSSSNGYGSGWYGNGNCNSRYGTFSNFYGSDSFFQRAGGSGPAGGGSMNGGSGGSTRTRSATGGGAGAGGGGYGGYGSYGTYAGGSRPGSARQASGANGANGSGTGRTSNSNNVGGGSRGGGAAGGAAAGGGGYAGFGRAGAPGPRPASGGRKWWEGGNDYSDDDDDDTFNF